MKNIKSTKYKNIYRRKNLKKTDRSEMFKQKIFFQAVVCIFLIPFLAVLLTFGRENPKSIGSRLTEAISYNIDSEKIVSACKDIKGYVLNFAENNINKVEKDNEDSLKNQTPPEEILPER